MKFKNFDCYEFARQVDQSKTFSFDDLISNLQTAIRTSERSFEDETINYDLLVSNLCAILKLKEKEIDQLSIFMNSGKNSPGSEFAKNSLGGSFVACKIHYIKAMFNFYKSILKITTVKHCEDYEYRLGLLASTLNLERYKIVDLSIYLNKNKKIKKTDENKPK